MPEMKTKNGWLTPYALACGYVEVNGDWQMKRIDNIYVIVGPDGYRHTTRAIGVARHLFKKKVREWNDRDGNASGGGDLPAGDERRHRRTAAPVAESNQATGAGTASADDHHRRGVDTWED